MHTDDPLKVVTYVNSLPDFGMATNIDRNYENIGATIADSVLQANNNYKRNVGPRITRIRREYAAVRTSQELSALLQELPVATYLNWKGADRIKRFSEILSLFLTKGIHTEAELRDWLETSGAREKLLEIHGVGPKTVDYLCILVGLPTAAIDRHLRNFLILANCVPGTYENSKQIIHAAADLLKVDRSEFDHSIWKLMSERRENGKANVCSAAGG